MKFCNHSSAILLLTVFSFIVNDSKAEDIQGKCDQNQKDGCKPLIDIDKVTSNSNYFRAAIYEHDRIDLASARASIKANLDVYDKAAKIAAANGSKIIVFPEDGLYDMPTDWVGDALEEIPDPDDGGHYNPCNDPQNYAKSEISLRLSCMAKANQMYVVANYGTRESCKAGQKVKKQVCPSKNQFEMNTNVVFSPDGTLLKRYRKWNLFIEAFDRATDIETVYFDTPLGRFGLVTCFDMLFKRPAMDLVEKHKIDTLLFPTWWYDELPMLPAIAVQDGWSLANNVNLIAANVHKPEVGSVGSGLYSSNLDLVHTSSSLVGPRLLIANLPKKPRNLPTDQKADIPFEGLSLQMPVNNPPAAYAHMNFKLTPTDKIEPLTERMGKKTVCNNEICCTINYEISQSSYNQDSIDRLKLIARDSLRQTTFKWYEQQCFLAELVSKEINLKEPKKNIFAEKATFEFHSLQMNATFNTHHVFPVALHAGDRLVHRSERQFDCQPSKPEYPDNTMFECQQSYKSSNKPEPIISFGLYGRVFERDQIDYSTSIKKIWPDDRK